MTKGPQKMDKRGRNRFENQSSCSTNRIVPSGASRTLALKPLSNQRQSDNGPRDQHLTSHSPLSDWTMVTGEGFCAPFPSLLHCNLPRSPDPLKPSLPLSGSTISCRNVVELICDLKLCSDIVLVLFCQSYLDLPVSELVYQLCPLVSPSQLVWIM